MLTDNSLGKLYLENTGELQNVIKSQEQFSPNERKNRPLSPDESPDIADFCTYLVPSEGEGEPTDFDHPEELRVIDPACGSGHFLLYAFDVLERIWRAETTLNEEEIPRKILQHNLYGVDLDMRACQLAAFNLYLKGRTRAKAEGADGFDMPEVGIVCADASIAEIDGVEAVFDEVAGNDEAVEDALRRILDAFEEVHGLGSLLDVRGTLGDLFEDDADIGGTQLTLGDDPRESHTLGQVLHSLREAVDEHRESDSFLAQDLRSFVRLLDILAQDYDVALMNPPYGSQNRMPKSVREYVEENYRYTAEFYINFFEVAESVSKKNGRIGMLVPWSFMFKQSFEDFRGDFIGEEGGFDFLAEYGYGVLDNATVGTVGTVVQSGARSEITGSFLRLHDLDTKQKEPGFLNTLSNESADDVVRQYNVNLDEFERIPGKPICYSIPDEVRALHDTELKLDVDGLDIEGESVCTAMQGLSSTDNERFLRQHWEGGEGYLPISRGGSESWIHPQVTEQAYWGDDGTEMRRYPTSQLRNEEFYGQAGLTWTYIKRTGRRFGYFPADGLFDYAGSMMFTLRDIDLWLLLGVINSNLYHSLFLSLTTERHWNIGEVGRIPWRTELEGTEKIAKKAKEQYRTVVQKATTNPNSPYYVAPALVPNRSERGFFYDHDHTEKVADEIEIRNDRIESDDSVTRLARNAEKSRLKKDGRLEELADEIDDLVYSTLNIDEQTQSEITSEIFLRTAEDSEDREVPNPESVPEIPDNINTHVKDLVHHFAMEAVQKESDGIIPVQGAENQADMLDRIVECFKNTYGKDAEDRLAEIDDILGAKSATEEAYPNLRAFIEDDLFDYHVSRMKNTPIVWMLTTERLLADSAGEGFGCFIDYHSIDTGLFDRLSNQYLEPRKAELRERRSAANRRRSDDSLLASEQAKAAEQYEHCASGLNQINVFEDVLQELGSVDEREFDDEGRALVEDLAPKVAAFRAETRDRVNTLAELHERKGEEWFQDTFSDKFWETVDKWRGEWRDALEDLEHACEEYTKPTDEPVEAHLADLFDYFNWRLKGSDHYSSSGILFMTYYFERESASLLDEDGQPHDHLLEDERLLASLAMGLNDTSIVDEEYLEAVADDEGLDSVDDLPPLAEFKALAEEIDDRCQTVDKRIPSDWADRALSEITTAGYQPNHKHGVEINITPLAQAEIVPETVDDDVL
jgi:hypothetical protein